jgi:hypothetical protein
MHQAHATHGRASNNSGLRFDDERVAMAVPEDPMAEPKPDLLRMLPARPLDAEERALLAEWLGKALDIPSAYFSERRSDDPAIYRRIVITEGPDDQVAHLIHCPRGMRLWVRTTVVPEFSVQLFDSLRAALNSIRQVLD